MKHRICHLLACAALSMPIGMTLAAGVALPGDRAPGGGGGMGNGGAPRAATAPAQRPPPAPPAPAPSIELALKAAQAIADACKQYPLAVAVTDAEGVAKLIYVPDGSAGWHGYGAVRKAYTAITFKSDTSAVIKKKEDPEIADKFKADPNLQAQSGGLLLMVGDKIVGAIGVSGAEPGGHDEECGLAGREKIKGDLK
jgi:uncharacterized protein GlcG (DUF336 family)